MRTAAEVETPGVVVRALDKTKTAAMWRAVPGQVAYGAEGTTGETATGAESSSG